MKKLKFVNVFLVIKLLTETFLITTKIILKHNLKLDESKLLILVCIGLVKKKTFQV